MDFAACSKAPRTVPKLHASALKTLWRFHCAEGVEFMTFRLRSSTRSRSQVDLTGYSSCERVLIEIRSRTLQIPSRIIYERNVYVYHRSAYSLTRSILQSFSRGLTLTHFGVFDLSCFQSIRLPRHATTNRWLQHSSLTTLLCSYTSGLNIHADFPSQEFSTTTRKHLMRKGSCVCVHDA